MTKATSYRINYCDVQASSNCLKQMSIAVVAFFSWGKEKATADLVGESFSFPSFWSFV